MSDLELTADTQPRRHFSGVWHPISSGNPDGPCDVLIAIGGAVTSGDYERGTYREHNLRTVQPDWWAYMIDAP